MEPTATALCIDDLLPLEDFVRALARRLVKDAATADDVVQEALLLAWQKPPRDRAALPAWLGTVVRRLASGRRQRDKARDQRERRAAQAEILSPSPEDILFREEKRRLVVEQLLALPEQAREVLLLHFYEGLSPKEIAARLSRPAGTVRSQLKRGLDELRTRLDRTHGGDRRSWALALIPLTLPGLGRPALVVSGSTILGVLAMKKTMVTVVSALVLASWGMWEAWLGDSGSTITDPAAVESVLAGDAGSRNDRPGDRSPEAGALARREQVLPDDAPAPKAGQLRLELLDAAGVPAPDLAYGLIEDEFGNRLEGWAHEVTSRIENHLLQQAPRSTTEGGLILPDRHEDMLLWVQRDEGLLQFFDLARLPADGKLHLAPEKKFVVHCPGLGKDERWQLYLQPALRDPEDGSFSFGRIYRRAGAGPGTARYLAMSVRRTVHRGGAPVEIRVPMGQHYNVEVLADRHKVAYEGPEYDAKVAPATWRFVPGPLLPKVEVVFVDAKDEPLPPQSGMWAVARPNGMIDHEHFHDQNPLLLPFQAFEKDAKYRIQVVTEMGDIRDWEIRFDGKRSDKVLRVVRAKPPAGLRLAVPDTIAGNRRWTLRIENPGGKLGGAVDLFLAPWMTSRPRPAFIPTDGSLIFLDGGQPFDRLWLHTSEGALAVYDPAADGVAAFRPLPLGERREIDLQKIYKRILATGIAVFGLRIEPRPGIVLEIQQMQTEGTATRWARMPCRLPKGIKAWLHVRMHDRTRVPVDIPLPLEDQD